MTTLTTIVRMAHADFRERSRRFSMLVMIAVSLYAGYGFLPPNHAVYATLRFGEHRGIYNSAWVGAAIAMLTATFVGLVGFYFLKNAIAHDRQTRVGQILAATPVSRAGYVVSKACSNGALLSLIALAVAVSAGVTQVVRAEDTRVHVLGLIGPYLLLTLPALWFIACVAAAFECSRLLRGGAGNVAYFFLWTIGIAASDTLLRGSGFDYIGFSAVVPSMLDACRAAFPECGAGDRGMALGLNFSATGAWHLTTFVWSGIGWTPDIAARRLVWIAGGVALAIGASRAFDRFSDDTPPPRAVASPDRSASTAAGRGRRAVDAAVQRLVGRSALLRLLWAEVQITLSGTSRAWFLVLAGLWVASAVVPLDLARLRILPMVWMWPVLLWSGIGSRERRFGTDQILFSAPHPLRRQLPALWLSGVGVAVLAGAVIGVRLLVAGDLAALAAWAVGAAFIPALALCLGVFTNSSRMFEGVYTALWYVGPLQPIAPLDFMGASQAAVESGTPLVFAALTAGLLALSVIGRRRQLQT